MTGTGLNSDWIGGIAGNNAGTISECYAAASVGGTGRVGGIAGNNSGTVEDCYATGNVSGKGTSKYIGGVVGQNNSSVTQCYATGAVSGSECVGGVVGKNEGTVSYCVALNASVSSGLDFGRACGYNDGTLTNNHGLTGMTGGPWTNNTATGKDGAEVTDTEAKTPSWWTTNQSTWAANWNFADGSYPTLK